MAKQSTGLLETMQAAMKTMQAEQKEMAGKIMVLEEKINKIKMVNNYNVYFSKIYKII